MASEVSADVRAAKVEVPGHAPLRAGACRVIAEAGVNHNNSVDQAIELARAAARAGAWAIKFQLYKADSITVPDSPKYWEDEFGTKSQYETFQKSDKLGYEEYGEVAAACTEAGIAFFATPFDLPAVDALEAIGAPLYKIASADITYRPLLEAVAATGKPVLLDRCGHRRGDPCRNRVDGPGARQARPARLHPDLPDAGRGRKLCSLGHVRA